jgi:5,10-methylenetetrahydromethanopterin reductase
MRSVVVDAESRLPAEATSAVAAAEQLGFDTFWTAGGWRDPLTLLALAGQSSPRIELGSSIVSVYGTHPTAAAEQALTVNAAVGGRLVLGLGVSHRHMVEGRFGMSFATPIRQLREYLTILGQAFTTGQLDFDGEALSAHTELRIVGAAAPVVLVSALSEQSLRVAGRLADGTLTTWIAPKALAAHTIPTLTAAATEAGRPAPRVVASVPVCVTADADGARERATREFDVYRTRYTAYQATFERQGVRGPADVMIAGDEQAVADGLAAFAEAGATDFSANIFGTPEEKARTAAFIVGQSRPVPPASPPASPPDLAMR